MDNEEELLRFLSEAEALFKQHQHHHVIHRQCTICGADSRETHEEFCLVGSVDDWLNRYNRYRNKTTPYSKRRRLSAGG